LKSLVSKRTIVLGVLAAALAAAAAVAASSSWSSAHASAARMLPDTMRNPMVAQKISEVAQPTGTVRFTCQLTTPAGCYGPDQMRQAYGVQTLLNTGHDGSGRTVVIIDAYGSPTLQADLDKFDTVWGLPAVTPTVIAPFGVDATTPDNAAGWAQETSLDVQWVHAIAPGATIKLVVAKSNNDSDILDATQYVIDHNLGDVVSQSFGEGERCMASTDIQRQQKLFAQGVRKGITFFASSGDQGAGQPNCDGSAGYFKSASTPASDVNVTGVGGTDLIADGQTGNYVSESTWNESEILGDAVSGGGGVSVLYGRPIWQALAAPRSRMREVPDVSYNAAIFQGVIAYWNGNAYRFGGTSAGSPQWSAIIAIVDQMAHHRVGNINPVLYLLGSNPVTGKIFHDVADGSTNTVPDAPEDDNWDGGFIQGYAATRGYDMATGLGSPNIGVLAPILAANAPSAG
jgi:subtilase family serine protease